ncbi:hypothetical protein FRX31_011778 [Thalictrum thalictroides]|uniref:F-box domain-containing protein n=1 Tax=Thalictrum thalictroides TaxID=46969 RepID=A0A7J6WQ85_THATH|nr:hypothetical protein FRX31_011778 [Thalictrum thalictroides]
MVSSRNWSELPHELLEYIAELLPTFEDYLSFVGVCRSWRSILVARLHYAFIRKSFPWLMLPQPDPWLMLHPEETDESDDVPEETDESDVVEVDESDEVEDDENAEVEVEDDESNEVEDNENDEVEEDDKHRHVDLDTHNFYSLQKEKLRHLELPDAVDCYCWGSPYGWLVIYCKEKMNLLNPLSNVYVALPPLSSLQHYNSSHSVRKAVLAISPASNTSSVTPLVDQFVALVIFSGNKKLAFARPGDRAWKTVNS